MYHGNYIIKLFLTKNLFNLICIEREGANDVVVKHVLCGSDVLETPIIDKLTKKRSAETFDDDELVHAGMG